ncbi:MAG TPA: discoidin domain-containing protein [Nitrososphaeraceae archaeon]|nr:discoidin domain-containing protein [Nitrososphaeraceae archaeon]
MAQSSSETTIGNNNTSLSMAGASASNESVSSQGPSGFVANGKINTLIDVPNGKWLAAGNWSIIISNGNVTSFNTKMTWYNSSGTNAHTHDLSNFKSISDNPQTLPVSTSNKQTTIRGVSDVSSNGKVSWFEVPTTITVNDRRIISISVDDSKTNSHFGGQSLLGIVDSFTECSDQPGPNMELLPPCSVNTFEETGLGFVNDSSAFSAFEGSIPTEDFQQGFPDQGFPTEDFQQGFPDQGFPSEDDQTGSGFPTQGFPSEDDQTGSSSSEDDQMAGGDEDQSGSEINAECTELDIQNITASGFESDPSDYHPPADAIDGEPSTWWSNNGKDPWIELELGTSQNICGVSVQWNKGDDRQYSFEVEISEDGNEYQKVFEGKNNQGSTDVETYGFEEEVNGQFVRLTVTDTSSSAGWTSIQEIDALGLPGG